MNAHAAWGQKAPVSLAKDADYLSEQGAYSLAKTIRAYWNRRGFQPRVWVAKLLSSASPTDGDRVVYVVKSDMIAGRPV